MAPPNDFAMQGLEALRRAVAQALEHKRLLGQYAVFWRDGRVVFEGPDAPQEHPGANPKTALTQKTPAQETDS